MSKVIVLSFESMKDNTFHVIDSDDIQGWVDDGSIDEDCLIIYPQKIVKAVRGKAPIELKDGDETDLTR